MRPYLQPNFTAEMLIANDVFKPLLSKANPLFREANERAWESTVDRGIFEWLDPNVPQSEPFLLWFCKRAEPVTGYPAHC